MRSRPGWGGGGADVEPPDAGAVRVESDPRPEDQLPHGVGAGEDVAADVVRVVRGHLHGVANLAPDDPPPEARREPLDLPQHRLRRIARVAVRDVGVYPPRVRPPVGTRRAREIALAGKDEPALAHPTAVDLGL